MSDIQALTERVTSLKGSIDFWNKLALWGVWVAAAIAVCAGITNTYTVRRGKELSAVQDELDTAKEKAANAEIAGVKAREVDAERSLAEQGQIIADRHLTQLQQNHLISALSTGPRGLVFVSSLGNDGEAMPFAKEIEAVLRKAGWSKDPVGGFVWEDAEPTGIQLIVKSKTDTPYHARLQSAFAAAGLPLVLKSEPRGESGKMYLVVGHKIKEAIP